MTDTEHRINQERAMLLLLAGAALSREEDRELFRRVVSSGALAGQGPVQDLLIGISNASGPVVWKELEHYGIERNSHRRALDAIAERLELIASARKARDVAESVSMNCAAGKYQECLEVARKWTCAS
jgi:hypothetical protein